MRRLLPIALWIVLFATALLIVGACGGQVAGAPSVSPAGTGGRATFTVKWPASQRLIPNEANSIVVTLSKDNKQLTQQKLTRPTSGGSSTASFDQLPYGGVTVYAASYTSNDGSGAPLTSGYGTLNVTENLPAAITLSLDSAVSKLSVAVWEGGSTVCSSGDSMVLVATGVDTAGNMVLLGHAAPITWSIDDSTLGQLSDPTEIWDYSRPAQSLTVSKTTGSTNVRARYVVYQGGPTVDGALSLQSIPRTMTLSGDPSCVYGSLIPQWNFPGTHEASYHVSATINPATEISKVEVPLTAEGPISSPSSTFFFGFYHSVTTNTVNAKHVDADTPATIRTQFGSSQLSVTTTIKANPLVSLTCPGAVSGGVEATGTVGLDLYALADETVSLSCDDPGVVIPSSVVVPKPTFTRTQGFNGVYNAVKTVDFKFKAPPVTQPKKVHIKAVRAGITKEFEVQVNP